MAGDSALRRALVEMISRQLGDSDDRNECDEVRTQVLEQTDTSNTLRLNSEK